MPCKHGCEVCEPCAYDRGYKAAYREAAGRLTQRVESEQRLVGDGLPGPSTRARWDVMEEWAGAFQAEALAAEPDAEAD